MIHFAFYVPKTHLEVVKHALFEAGAGKLGNYDQCSFDIQGIGQFRGLDGSDQFLGKKGLLERVEEVKVEMVCEESLMEEIILTLKRVHPYETPAYYAIKTLDY